MKMVRCILQWMAEVSIYITAFHVFVYSEFNI